MADYSTESDEDFGFYEDSESSYESSLEESDDQSSEEEQHRSVSMRRPIDKMAPVNIKLDEAVFTFNMAFSPQDISRDMASDETNDGSILLSQLNKNLKREFCTSTRDFERKQPMGQHDVVLFAKVEIASNYPGTVELGFPTLSADSKNQFSSEHSHISMRLFPTEFNGKMHTKTIADRTLNAGRLAFLERYRGQTPDNMEKMKLVVKNYEKSYDVRAESPKAAILYFYYDDKDESKKPVNPTELPMNKKSKTVKFTKEQVAKYMPLAKESMRHNLYFGDVTGDFQLRIQSDEHGSQQYRGMATTPNSLDGTDKQASFARDVFFFRGRVTLQYKNVNSRTVEFEKVRS